jgi:hypothetical protein
MKTLYAKLKPEFKQKLKEQEEKYQASVECVVKSLEDNVLWSDLNISDVHKFIVFTDETMYKLNSYDIMYGEKFLVADE